MFKKLVVGLIMVGFLGLLGIGALAGEKEDADVVMLFSSGSFLVPMIPNLEKSFEEQTGYDVYFQLCPGAEISKVLQLGAATNSLPDVFQGSVNSQFEMFAEKGLLLPLDDLLKEIGVDLTKYPSEVQKIFDLCRYEGKLYAIPLSPYLCGVLHYNKDLFDREGIPYPTTDMGWENFKNLCRKLVKKDEKGNIIRYGCMHKYAMLSFAYGFGGRIVDDYIHPTKVMFGDDTYVDAIQEFLDLTEEGAFVPLPVYKNVFGSSKPKIFGEEHSAMIITHMSYGGGFKNLPFDWDVIIPPYPKNADTHFPVTYGIEMIAKTAKNPKAALSWAYWYCASPERTEATESLRKVTISSLYYNEKQRETLAKFADKRKPVNWRIIYEMGKKSLMQNMAISCPEFDDIFWTATWDVLYGKEPAIYLKKAAAEAQKVLDEYNETH